MLVIADSLRWLQEQINQHPDCDFERVIVREGEIVSIERCVVRMRPPARRQKKVAGALDSAANPL